MISKFINSKFFVFCSLFFLLAHISFAQKEIEKPEAKEQTKNLNTKQAKKSEQISGYMGNVVDEGKNTENKGANYSGKISQKKLDRRLRDSRNKATEVANFSGNIRYKDARKAFAKNSKLTAEYSGTLSVRKLEALERNSQKNVAKMDHYRGTIRYVNFRERYKKKSQTIASFKGPNPVLIARKKPKGSITSEYKGAPNKNRRPANYNKQKLKSGRMLKKSELPNYQKTKPTKLKYNSRETKMWLEGGKITPKTQDRKLPKTSKKQKKKVAEEEIKQGE